MELYMKSLQDLEELVERVVLPFAQMTPVRGFNFTFKAKTDAEANPEAVASLRKALGPTYEINAVWSAKNGAVGAPLSDVYILHKCMGARLYPICISFVRAWT